MLKRTLWEKLTEWKERPHHPLVLEGLRQTGKTYLVQQFGKDCYENMIYLDLRADRIVHSAFDNDFNVDQMVMSISASKPSAHFIPGKTLLVFDEIQDCPNARSSLKYWDLDGRYDVIATGSFLGVKGFREPYLRGIPVGYEERLTMYPLSFREFLINTGIDPAVLDYVDTSLKEHKPIEQTVHQSMRSLYFQYLIAGGMPEAVNVFFDTHDLNAVRTVQQRILSSIRDDFGRYKNTNGEDRINEVLKLRAEACLASMPAQLSKEYKKFQYSLVNAKGHSPEKSDGLQYLVDVGLIVRAHNTSEIASPLEGVKKASEFKAYYVDTGLLISQLGDEVPGQILSGNISSYKGAIAENMVASAVVTGGGRLYYYRAPSGSPELDFLLERNGEAVIVECKASNNRATSMKYVLSHPKKYGKHAAIKFSDTNVGGGEGFDTYPLYAVGFLPSQQKKNIIPAVDTTKLRTPL